MEHMDDVKPVVDFLKAAFDAMIAFEELPTRYTRTRDGWAAYKGNTRITRFFFSEQGAREAAIDRDAADVKTQF